MSFMAAALGSSSRHTPLATGRSTLTASFCTGKIRSIHQVSSSGNWSRDRVSPVGAMSRMMRS